MGFWKWKNNDRNAPPQAQPEGGKSWSADTAGSARGPETSPGGWGDRSPGGWGDGSNSGSSNGKGGWGDSDVNSGSANGTGGWGTSSADNGRAGGWETRDENYREPWGNDY